jgi:hypothetical protein
MVAKIAGQRAQQGDVNKVSGAAGVGENPPVITKEAGQKAEPAARKTGGKGTSQSGTGHDGVMGKRGGTST